MGAEGLGPSGGDRGADRATDREGRPSAGDRPEGAGLDAGAAARAEFLNVTLRYVATDAEAVLAYAPGPRVAAVTSFSQEVSPDGEADMMVLTEGLIERVVGLGGAFYLPYRLHACRDQVARAYPGAARFADAKRRYDAALTFRNALWTEYFA